MNQVHIDVQRMVDDGPEEPDIQRCIDAVIKAEAVSGDVELTVRIVDENEIAQLNQTYRNKTTSTNILSFPFELPADMATIEGTEVLPVRLLGDLVIASAVVVREAQAQEKTEAAHWAHMLVHGVLHLLGHDHQQDGDAEEMEHKEITILKTLGYSNPYRVKQSA